jgi:hypothetical protein
MASEKKKCEIFWQLEYDTSNAVKTCIRENMKTELVEGQTIYIFINELPR